MDPVTGAGPGRLGGHRRPGAPAPRPEAAPRRRHRSRGRGARRPGGGHRRRSGRRHPLGHLGPIRGQQTPGVSRPVDISPSGQGSQGETHHQQTHQADPGEDGVLEPRESNASRPFCLFSPDLSPLHPPRVVSSGNLVIAIVAANRFSYRFTWFPGPPPPKSPNHEPVRFSRRSPARSEPGSAQRRQR